MVSTPRQRGRADWIAAIFLAVFLIVITAVCMGSAFRDNDQAMLVYGGLNLAQGHANPLRTDFYNYDKQWGSYLLLAGMFRIFPGADPVLMGNLLQAGLLVSALLLALWAAQRRHRLPLWAALPIWLSPALVLYVPFLATASLSLAFLLFVFVLLRRRGGRATRLLALSGLAAAAACRGDVVLVLPILLLSTIPRSRLMGLVRRKWFWAYGVAAVAPVLLGRLLDVYQESNFAGLVFSPPMFAGFLAFALGPGVVVVLAVLVGSRIWFCVRKPRWIAFYVLELIALLIPIAFYWAQLFRRVTSS